MEAISGSAVKASRKPRARRISTRELVVAPIGVAEHPSIRLHADVLQKFQGGLNFPFLRGGSGNPSSKWPAPWPPKNIPCRRMQRIWSRSMYSSRAKASSSRDTNSENSRSMITDRADSGRCLWSILLMKYDLGGVEPPRDGIPAEKLLVPLQREIPPEIRPGPSNSLETIRPLSFTEARMKWILLASRTRDSFTVRTGGKNEPWIPYRSRRGNTDWKWSM